MKSLTEQFTDWVRTKPRDEGYHYSSCTRCPMAQFLFTSGIAIDPSIGPGTWRDMASAHPKHRHPFSRSLEGALVEVPWTFGALADRLTLNQNGGDR